MIQAREGEILEVRVPGVETGVVIVRGFYAGGDVFEEWQPEGWQLDAGFYLPLQAERRYHLSIKSPPAIRSFETPAHGIVRVGDRAANFSLLPGDDDTEYVVVVD